MALRAKDDFRKYVQQQLDLGYNEIHLPVATRGTGKTSTKARVQRASSITPLPFEKFTEATTLDVLEKTIEGCQKCRLGKTRTKFVFGTGNPESDVMFVGEAPGRDEDMQGKPFVGRAGKLLDKMLIESGLKREDVYITNVIKSRPPDNRDPLPDEIEACEPYLITQIKIMKPKIICALGRIAGQTLLKTKMTLGEMRNRWFDYHGVKLMVTYHPAAILRNMSNYEISMEDFDKLKMELRKITR
jgi:uracil-DNA glycosylase family 4